MKPLFGKREEKGGGVVHLPSLDAYYRTTTFNTSTFTLLLLFVVENNVLLRTPSSSIVSQNVLKCGISKKIKIKMDI